MLRFALNHKERALWSRLFNSSTHSLHSPMLPSAGSR